MTEHAPVAQDTTHNGTPFDPTPTGPLAGAFGGADRVRRYSEPPPVTPDEEINTDGWAATEEAVGSGREEVPAHVPDTTPAPAPEPAPTQGRQAVSDQYAPPPGAPRSWTPGAYVPAGRPVDEPAAAGWGERSSGGDAAVRPALQVLPAMWGFRGWCNRASGGALKLAPSEAELTHRDNVATIGRATWTRAVNVAVLNSKGGKGKTPTSVILAGILGDVRGGSVLAWEATDTAGTLTARAEGHPARGLGQLVEQLGDITSAGNLSGYTAPQTSHADVLGSVGARWSLTAHDVLGVRKVLDRYYRITVTDTGNNPAHPAYRAAVATADAVVMPCLLDADALAGVEEVGDVLLTMDQRTHQGLLSRVVVVLGHDGGPENKTVAAGVRERLARLSERGVTVVEVPFDPTIRAGGSITLELLSRASTRAWTGVGAAVVGALQKADTRVDLVASEQRALDQLDQQRTTIPAPQH